MVIQIRPALPTDLSDVMWLLDLRVAWLAERGLDQWSTSGGWRPKMLRSIQAGEVWIAHDKEFPVATVTLSRGGDADFWTAEELTDDAVYLSKLATNPDYKGKRIGATVLAWARNHAARIPVSVLRLDAWRSNSELHQYYLSQGWRHVRTEVVEGRKSGTLFETPAAAMPVVGITEHAPRPEQKRSAWAAGQTASALSHSTPEVPVVIRALDGAEESTYRIVGVVHETTPTGGSVLAFQARPEGSVYHENDLDSRP